MWKREREREREWVVEKLMGREVGKDRERKRQVISITCFRNTNEFNAPCLLTMVFFNVSVIKAARHFLISVRKNCSWHRRSIQIAGVKKKGNLITSYQHEIYIYIYIYVCVCVCVCVCLCVCVCVCVCVCTLRLFILCFL